MSLKRQFQSFAAYNTWANQRLYAAAGDLPAADFTRDLGAFFGSLAGTLNHIAMADALWLKRLTGRAYVEVTRLDFIFSTELPRLQKAREDLDRLLAAMVEGFSDADLGVEVDYTTMTRGAARNRRADIIQHLFNHQTHHRGQAHGLLSQLRPGVEPPSLDLIYFLNIRD